MSTVQRMREKQLTENKGKAENGSGGRGREGMSEGRRMWTRRRFYIIAATLNKSSHIQCRWEERMRGSRTGTTEEARAEKASRRDY